jgi:hypothetical protein
MRFCYTSRMKVASISPTEADPADPAADYEIGYGPGGIYQYYKELAEQARTQTPKPAPLSTMLPVLRRW